MFFANQPTHLSMVMPAAMDTITCRSVSTGRTSASTCPTTCGLTATNSTSLLRATCVGQCVLREGAVFIRVGKDQHVRFDQ